MRRKGFYFAAQISRKKLVGFNAQYFGEHEKLQIRNAPGLAFQPRDGFAAGVPAKQLQFQCKLVLRPTLVRADFPHLRADDV